MRWLLLVCSIVSVACGTTIYADHYANDCDADNQCVRIVAGDQCACTCSLAAINERDYDKYISDVEHIGGCRTNCSGSDPDAGFTCGQGVGARCGTAGKCVIYQIPDASSAE
jgi:hypothetical protein